MWLGCTILLDFLLEFFPKWFLLNSVTKIYDIKRTRTCHPATSCVRDQHATTVLARHMCDIGSLNWAQFMLQWFIIFSLNSQNSVKVLLHFGKTPLSCRPLWLITCGLCRYSLILVYFQTACLHSIGSALSRNMRSMWPPSFLWLISTGRGGARHPPRIRCCYALVYEY